LKCSDSDIQARDECNMVQAHRAFHFFFRCHLFLETMELSAAGACFSILKCYTQLRERFETMKDIEKNWQDLMTEVLSYEVLVKKKAAELVQLSKDDADVDPHMGAIQVFETSIKGLCELFSPEEDSKGALKKAYSLLKRFSSTPENAKKLKEYTCKISRAAALISLSEIVAVKDKVASVESKVDALINDGKVLIAKLDAALEKHLAETTPKNWQEVLHLFSVGT
jgi:hypothetical protein